MGHQKRITQDARDIVARARCLSEAERNWITIAIRESIRQDDMAKSTPMFYRYKAAMESVLGESLPYKSRVNRFAWARAIIAHQMRKDGVVLTTIARVMGFDPSTILNMETRVNQMIDSSFGYELEKGMYNNFKTLIRNGI